MYIHRYRSLSWLYKVGSIYTLSSKKMNPGRGRMSEPNIDILNMCVLSNYFLKFNYKMIKVISCTFTKWPHNLEPEIFFSATSFGKTIFFNVITSCLQPNICGSKILPCLKFIFFSFLVHSFLSSICSHFLDLKFHTSKENTMGIALWETSWCKYNTTKYSKAELHLHS